MDIKLKILLILEVCFVIIGFLVLTSNLAIFAIFARKPKKTASESLILCTLLIDAFYGADILFLGVQRIFLFDVSPVAHFWLSVIHFIPYYSLVVASLMMQILITINRYYAVMKPFRYKYIFNTNKILLAVIGIAVTSLSFGVGGFIAFTARVGHGPGYFFDFAWHSVRLILVITEAVFLFIVYRAVSKRFLVPFWEPVLIPMKKLLLCSSSKDRLDKNSATHPSDVLIVRGTQNSKAVFRINKTKSQLTESESNSKAEVEFKNEQKESSVTDGYEAEISNNESVEVELGQEMAENCADAIRNDSETGYTKVNFQQEADETCGKANAPKMAEICKDNTTKDSDTGYTNVKIAQQTAESCAKNKRSSRDEMERKRMKQKHKTTATFFFTGTMFLLMSIPNCIVVIIIHMNQNKNRVLYIVMMTTYAMFGMSFLLNPYLFAFNSSYVREQFRKLCCRNKEKK